MFMNVSETFAIWGAGVKGVHISELLHALRGWVAYRRHKPGQSK